MPRKRKFWQLVFPHWFSIAPIKKGFTFTIYNSEGDRP